MPILRKITISFVTNSFASPVLDAGLVTFVHVFVKNRRSDTSLPEGKADFVSNLLAYDAADAAQTQAGINPYLGRALTLDGVLAVGVIVDQPADIPLRSQPILPGEVILPVVNIHLRWPVYVQWAFSYTINFQFDDGAISYSPADDGIPSILLDSNNPDYSGICHEVSTPAPAPAKPATEPVYLTQLKVDFWTHGDDKAADTKLDIRVVNRLNAVSGQDIAIGPDLFAGQQFPQHENRTVLFRRRPDLGPGGPEPVLPLRLISSACRTSSCPLSR